MQEMMNQFKNMTLMLQEVVQSNKQVVNPIIRTTTCRNCQVQGHDAAYCTKPCKICKGADGSHVFWKCPQYISPSNQARIAQLQEPVLRTEHVLLEDAYSLEDLYVNEEILNNDERHASKRVRVEDLEDLEDEVRFVREPSQATQGIPTKRKQPARVPRPVAEETTKIATSIKAATQLMNEAKLSLTVS